ncbi:MAG: hypothetical protein IJP16_01015, partial [Clostridia bacterium]|nr:hypothetical protein [Clostridia bacterium]
QPPQKANCFLDYIHLNENRQFSQRKLLANQRFAVEILEFRLSIIVITGDVKRGCEKLVQNFSQPLIIQNSAKIGTKTPCAFSITVV